ncbi:MAG TPA: nickel-binding protein [Kofleriaceae bacterium]|nr:nickel-binding protein [Kofleriaceae bacterium]
MTTVLVEYQHDLPLSDDELAVRVAKLRPCFEVREIKWLHAYLSFDRKTQFAVFEAVDAETVRTVHGMLGVAFVRIVPTTVVV